MSMRALGVCSVHIGLTEVTSCFDARCINYLLTYLLTVGRKPVHTLLASSQRNRFVYSVIEINKTHIAWWRGGVAVERRTRDQEVAGSSLGGAPWRKNSGQVSHTYVPLSPSSIIWYRRKLGSKQERRAIRDWPRIRGLAS